MDKVNMSCYTWFGAIDLYHGVPDLKGAVVEDVICTEEKNKTVLVLRRTDGELYKIMIAHAED